jgi:dolichol-phosphate mannosyltransferase
MESGRPTADQLDLSVITPALNEGLNLALLLPSLREVLDGMKISYEILIVTSQMDRETMEAASSNQAKLIEQEERGYGGALLKGFADARGDYILTMDADLSHRPTFIPDLWACRTAAEVIIASRYVEGGSATMPKSRYILSRLLNIFFSIGLRLPIRDMSSGFRLYQAPVVRGLTLAARDFAVLQEILVRACVEGYRVREVAFHYVPREHGSSNARIIRFGISALKVFWPLWRLRRNGALNPAYNCHSR